MANNPASWDDYFSSEDDAAPSTSPYSGFLGRLKFYGAPFLQGASYGLAGNAGMLPSDYAAQRKANPFTYQGLEDLGMIAAPVAAMAAAPEVGLGAGLTAPEAMLTRYAGNSILGAAMGAAGTNVTGGDAWKNANLGMLLGGPLGLAPEALSAVAPTISPKVAKYISDYSSMFGNTARTVGEMGDLIADKFKQFVTKAGGIDTLTTLPQGGMYPEQTLGERLAAIASRDYRGAGNTGDDVQAVVGNLLDVARSNKGIIDPAAYTRFTQSGGDVAALARSPHGLGRDAGGDIRAALDDALAMQSSGLAERFNLASKAHNTALQDYQDASNALTFAQAKHLPTDNVYGTASANTDISAAEAKLEDAQQRALRSAAEKDAIVERLQGAQGHEALGETPDLDAINQARNAHKLWKVAQLSGSGTDKLSINKLATQAEKFFRDPNAVVASPTDMAQAATAQSVKHSLLGKAASWLPGGIGIGAGEEIARNIFSPFAEHVAANPGATGLGLAVGIPAAYGINAFLRSPMVAKAAVRKALDEAPIGMLRPEATSAAVLGATSTANAGGSPQHTSWDDYFTSP